MDRSFQLIVKGRFPYLWIKYVTGFREDVHCAKALIGKYSNYLQYRNHPPGLVVEGRLDEHPGIVYLCGNTGKLERNVHLALAPCPGKIVEFECDTLKFTAEGFQRLPILPVITDLPAEFATCRNWQFGKLHFGGGNPDPNQKPTPIVDLATPPQDLLVPSVIQAPTASPVRRRRSASRCRRS
jgi:hypothetical protein